MERTLIQKRLTIYPWGHRYRPFHKTLPRTSAFVNWISVRFIDIDCSCGYLFHEIPPIWSSMHTEQPIDDWLVRLLSAMVEQWISMDYFCYIKDSQHTQIVYQHSKYSPHRKSYYLIRCWDSIRFIEIFYLYIISKN